MAYLETTLPSGNIIAVSTIANLDGTIDVSSPTGNVVIGLNQDVEDTLASAIQPGDNTSELTNDGDGISPFATEASVDLKADDNNVIHKTGDEIKTSGTLTLNESLYLPSLIALPSTFNNIGVDDTGAVINIPIEISTSGSIKVSVTNKTGVTILKGSAVYINGAQGSKATIALALADPDVNTSAALGLVEADILNNASGYVVTSGEILNLNTNVFSNGDKVYISPTIPGGLVNVVPTSPNNVVFMGTVTNSHSTQGKILINIVYTTKLDRLVDVAISGAVDKQLLTYEASSGLWKNKTLLNTDLISILGYTPENVSNKQNDLSIDGTGTKYPTVDAVNASLTSLSIPDATDTIKGKLKLSGDLAGTANAPTVPLVRYTNATPTPTSIGGIAAGTTFSSKTMTEMWDAILYPELFPTLVNPSNTFTSSILSLYEIGSVIASMAFNATFSRGSISPAYGTSGFRSGLPTTYNTSGPGLTNVSSTSLSNSQTITSYTIPLGAIVWQSSVTYSGGDQPLSSKGNPTGSPLAPGTTSVLSKATEGVYPIFATSSSIGTLTKQSLVSMVSGNNIVIVLVAEIGGKQRFEIADAWLTGRPLIGVQQLNTVSGLYEYPGGTAGSSLSLWNITSSTEVIQGNTINYKTYTYNSSVDRAGVSIRLIF